MNRFEDLEVRQLGRELNKELGKIFYDPGFRNRDFQSQIMRASQSITNNIAEGRERLSDKQFVLFLGYAKGSSGEVRSMLYSAIDLGYIHQEQFKIFYKKTTTISVKLYNLITYLKKTSTHKK